MQGANSLPNLDTFTPTVLPGHDISVKEMYNIAMRNNTVWGIEGYQVPKQYLDSRKLAEISQNKVKRPAPRTLKTKDYLTAHMEAVKKLPAPNKYDIVKPWVDDKKKAGPPKHVTKRNTYIDNIIHENTKRPTPGPGAHNLRETDEHLKKRLAAEGKHGKGSDRTDFLCEMQYLSNTVPGPGNYNPRDIQPKLKETRMKPEDWKKKHSEKRAKSAFPDIGTYNPYPAHIKTFGKQFELHKEKKDVTKVKAWGTAVRFVFKKDAKKDPHSVPGPGTYAMTATWNGKLAPNDKDKKDKNWMNKITKGVEKSIYYS